MDYFHAKGIAVTPDKIQAEVQRWAESRDQAITVTLTKAALVLAAHGYLIRLRRVWWEGRACLEITVVAAGEREPRWLAWIKDSGNHASRKKRGVAFWLIEANWVDALKATLESAWLEVLWYSSEKNLF